MPCEFCTHSYYSWRKICGNLQFFCVSCFGVAIPAAAQNAPTLSQRIRQLTTRPIFKHSTVGVEVYDLTAQKTLVAINEDKLFTSGSTTKLVTEGAALALLGENYRFHTRVYPPATSLPMARCKETWCWSPAATLIFPDV